MHKPRPKCQRGAFARQLTESRLIGATRYATSASPPKKELKDRIMAAIDDFSLNPMIDTWNYKLDPA
jgi:hypothetical protein